MDVIDDVHILDFSCVLIRFSMNMMLSSILKYDYLVLNLPLEKHFSGRKSGRMGFNNR